MQVPLAPLPPGTWASLAIDIRGLVARCFADHAQPPRAPASALNSTYAALEGIVLSGTGRLRRVFTLRDAPRQEVCSPALNVLPLPAPGFASTHTDMHSQRSPPHPVAWGV